MRRLDCSLLARLQLVRSERARGHFLWMFPIPIVCKLR